jgi:hypothetical protein
MENEEQIETSVLSASQNLPFNKTRTFRNRILSPLVCSVCASIGIFGGIAALFIGLVFAVMHAAVADDRSYDKASTILLIAAIPAILIGSIFLDEIAGNKPAYDGDVRKR